MNYLDKVLIGSEDELGTRPKCVSILNLINESRLGCRSVIGKEESTFLNLICK